MSTLKVNSIQSFTPSEPVKLDDTVHFTVEISGGLVPNIDDSFNLGSLTKKWKDLYIDGRALVDKVETNHIVGGASVYNPDFGGNLTTLGISSSLIVSGNVTPPSSSISISTGEFNLGSSTSQWKDLYIAGNAYVDELISSSITQLGNVTTQNNTKQELATASFDAISSSLVPVNDNGYDLGTSTYQWKDLYVDGVAYIDKLSIAEVEVEAGPLEFNGALDISGSIIPSADSTFDLGSSAKQWDELYVDNISGRTYINSASATTIQAAAITASKLTTTSDVIVNSSNVNFNNLPTSDPGVSGRLFTTQSFGTGGNLDGKKVVLVSAG